jgi:Zn ribbon nucleic-acid-binding protein
MASTGASLNGSYDKPLHSNRSNPMNSKTPKNVIPLHRGNMNSENINMYFSPQAPTWLKELITSVIEQQKRDGFVEDYDRRAGEHYRAHILKNGTDEEKAQLQWWDEERIRDEQMVKESLAKTEIKKELLTEVSKKEPKFFHQIDGFSNSLTDCVFSPDEDGDCMMGVMWLP